MVPMVPGGGDEEDQAELRNRAIRRTVPNPLSLPNAKLLDPFSLPSCRAADSSFLHTITRDKDGVALVGAGFTHTSVPSKASSSVYP